ncbi:hypothetical protein FOZ60_002105 [Perkinsus olseni]|uniref:Inner membrane component domain-containing protein n=1 Tax=Perkinsus olseni TaxID=32597 RepID=A0A7J6NYU5_PEROL|nr:hypothetical protein FOZ60_002105 [Perkinsus olseni]
MSSPSSSEDSGGETFHVERKRGCAAWLCNLLWILSGSFLPALFWFLLALLLCITVVGIPFGVQCYKMGKLALLPFGYKVIDKGGILCCGIDWLCNCLWWLPGIIIAAFEIICAVISFISIIGVPFGIQHCKLAKLAMHPFGLEVQIRREVQVQDV